MSTRKAYAHSLSYSDECASGDGYCDGFIPEGELYQGEECGCGCHHDYTDLPDTTKGVAEWHQETHRLFGIVT